MLTIILVVDRWSYC